MLYPQKFRWIAVLCIIALCTVCSGCQKTPVSQQNAVAANWDECHLYYGLNREEITLDVSRQNELGELIFNYSLKETSDEPIPTEEIMYGGPYIFAVFVKDDVTYTWGFNPNRFVKTVTEGDSTTQTYYEPSSSLMNKLNNFQ